MDSPGEINGADELRVEVRGVMARAIALRRSFDMNGLSVQALSGILDALEMDTRAVADCLAAISAELVKCPAVLDAFGDQVDCLRKKIEAAKPVDDYE